MALNPFEQLHHVHVEPRQAFEEAAANILRAVFPGSKRVRVHQGDGGVDVFRGSYGPEGALEVYQIKFFPGPFDDSRKRQIKDSYATALNSSDYRLRKWILCVPVRLTKDDLRWFDEWAAMQDVPAEVLDGDELTDLLQRDECRSIRQQLRSWGVMGMQAGGALFEAGIFARDALPAVSGLTFMLGVLLHNVGDRTAKGVKVEISHDETHCVMPSPDPNVWHDDSMGTLLNPARLRCRQDIHPGEKMVILPIKICDRTPFPFSVALTISGEDLRPTHLRGTISKDQAAASGYVPLDSVEASLTHAHSQDSPVRPEPTSPEAKQIMEAILVNPVPANRGVTEILQGMPGNTLDAVYVATTITAGAGGVRTMRQRAFRAAIAELLQLGWLLEPESDGMTAVYEFNAE